MKKKKRFIIISSTFAILLVFIICYIIYGNTALETNTYTVSIQELPSAFDGYRIAHVSDLHNTKIGKNNKKLISKLKETKTDIIAITGDLIDSRKTDVQTALDFAKQAVEIAPCYYVPGNHEARSEEYDTLKKGLKQIGVIVLDDERTELEKAGETLALLGVKDPRFMPEFLTNNPENLINFKINRLKEKEDTVTILLSHRPELFEVYCYNDINLVLTGHAHGGQFRFFSQGLVAPDQGFFPKYDSGLYVQDKTNMIVSRGIGNSIFPFRVNNNPEIVLIELKKIEY